MQEVNDGWHEEGAPVRKPALEPWGIAELDAADGGGLAGRAFNMVAMPDYQAACAMAAHFLREGLRGDGRVAVVAIENPAHTLGELSRYGVDFEAALRLERLAYLYYKATFLHALGLSTDYTAVFAEIRRLAGPVRRVVLLSADLIFNLQSEHLAAASVTSAIAAAGRMTFTVLGCFVHLGTSTHQLLDASCSNLMPSYLRGTRLPTSPGRYRLDTRRCLGSRRGPVVLDIDAAHGRIRAADNAETA